MEENNDIDVFEFVFDSERMAGVFGVSLVQDPAIDIQMMKFNKETEQIWKMSSEEKRILTSPVLIPNQKIYRNNIQGKPGYVFASEHTIEQLQQNFAKQKYGHNSMLEHSDVIEGVYFSESWIITDPQNDKANALGFKDLPKGTWMLSMKVDNDEIWNEYVKTGKIGGFSIDGELATKQINNNNKQIKFKSMNTKTIQEIIKMSIQQVALASELKEFKISDSLSYYASDLEIGSIITDVDGNPIPNVEFEYEGKKYKTDDLGALIELPVEAPAEEEAPAEADAPTEEVAVDEEPVAEVAVEEDDIDALKAENEALKKKIAELEVENSNLEAQIVSTKSELVDFKSQAPASLGITERPKVELSSVSNKGLSKIEVIRQAIQNNK